jgi:hypothetical protein
METKQKIEARVLRPIENSGSIHGDYGYILNGVKSTRGYATRRAASNALERAITRLINQRNDDR